ncbi:MAG TPA: ribonuclease HI family protein [Acidobacteriaceae bacterium]|nr:ribonuclease HI family protein [Acidobacteriaceae bacterium]
MTTQSTLFSGSPKPSQEFVIAHCDGGSRGNPGPSGYGAIVEDANGRVLARLSEYLGKKTNNYAEYSGLLAVLAWALENNYPRLRVVSDSELMVKQMTGRYKVNSPDLKPLWVEAHKRANQLERFEITHTLRGGNKEADQLANDAMDRGMGRVKPELKGSAPQPNPAAGAAAIPIASRPAAKPSQPVQPQSSQAKPRQILEGFVKNGVVHLLEGELPDGIFVKIIRE